jgi:hypothetical protein
MNMLYVSGVENLSNSPTLQVKFFRISLKIFSLILLLYICYIIFDICDIGPSFLPRSDVTLLKNTESAKVSNKKHNDELSKFSSKRYRVTQKNGKF